MLPLSEQSRGRILALRRGPGFDDLLDLCAKLCETSERNLLQLDRANGASNDQIISAQEQCRAQRIFVQNLFAEIEMQVNALVAGQAAKAPTDEEILGIDPVAEAADMLGLIPSEESMS